MTEAKLENLAITAFAAAIPATIRGDIQTLGAWSGGVTAELSARRGYLTCKVSPRSYPTFTTAEAEFTAEVTLTMRVETGLADADHVTVTEALAAVTHGWQRSYSAYSSAFAIAGEFQPTGFRLDGGDCGIDRERGIWTWTQRLTLQGLITTTTTTE